ncbi:MAG: OmpA family protein [Bacteroidetes bacterium]|nr:OmpA family protein [Bacteroidota bacterium]
MRKYIIFLFCLNWTFIQAQKDVKLISINEYADCSQAKVINTSHVFGPTTAPDGHGQILEFFNNSRNSNYFIEEEHNTVWYKFKTTQDGILLFDLIPENDNDDYDFVLYIVEQGQGCSQIVNKDILPVRTNISRNDPSINSRTGLALSIKNKFEAAGKGASFSSGIHVKKGDLYYLLIDNVYENGSGHTLVFDYVNDVGESKKPKIISDKVIDAESEKGLGARVILQDKDGNIIAETTSHPITGEYSLEIPADFDYRKDYSINICTKGYFFKEREVNITEKINTKKKENVEIQRLEKGKKFSLSTIYFYENSPMYLPVSISTLDKLFKLMTQNEQMTIEIAGHIHGCGADPDHIKTLSEARALTVKNYLLRKGVQENRISTIGYGCSQMLYPKPKNEEEKQMNRRVEITILAY